MQYPEPLQRGDIPRAISRNPALYRAARGVYSSCNIPVRASGEEIFCASTQLLLPPCVVAARAPRRRAARAGV